MINLYLDKNGNASLIKDNNFVWKIEQDELAAMYDEVIDFGKNKATVKVIKFKETGEPYIVEEKNPNYTNVLRQRREIECFRVINRGSLWEETLTEEQRNELRVWYHLWLDVTETMVVPERPAWLS